VGRPNRLRLRPALRAELRRWHNVEDPWTSDYQQIFQTVFPHANSIAGALIANPSAFVHHLASNLIHSPIEVGGLIFGHFNVILPRFKLYTLAEAGLLAAALLTLVYSLARSYEPNWTIAWRVRFRRRQSVSPSLRCPSP
jgi:hypothetical protein